MVSISGPFTTATDAGSGVGNSGLLRNLPLCGSTALREPFLSAHGNARRFVRKLRNSYLREEKTHMNWVRIIVIGWAVCSMRAAWAAPPDFGREIRPVLADKCFRCHGPDEAARQSGLRLDVRDEALAAADSGAKAIVPGQPEESELVRRIMSSDASEAMPPPDSKQALSAAEKQLLRDWIQAGAPYSGHWSLEPLRRPPVPEVAEAWSRHPLDAFVAHRHREQGLEHSPEAERYTLARRVYLDLTGLPPTPAEADQFVADAAPDAYERLVERLLASPAFGERMAWDWLDAARYADSNGYQGDNDRTMWPWRDWVVEALNANLPFDRFTVWQLAGDQLPEATAAQRLATGFCRNHMINGEGGRIPAENRVDYVMDMTETMGTIWLGATLNCCRCHDHKYDPFSRRDYYSLFAFFNQTPIDGSGGNPQTPPVLEVISADLADRLRRSADEAQRKQDQLKDYEQRWTTTSAGDADGADEAQPPPELPDEIQKILAQAPDARKNEQLDQLEKHFAEQAQDYVELLKSYRTARNRRDATRQAIPRVMVMQDQPEPRQTFLLDKGLYNRPGEEVSARVPDFLPPLSAEAPANRLGLAQWLMSEENPLVARVIVNRYWQQFFGQGLVATSEDFGTQGELPSHPKLLDWLAVEFRASGWDVKQLCRLIVTSSTYRQSSRVTPEQYEQDPPNRWLARGPRYRLPSWMIRDAALAASGLLVHRQGGPPVNPYQPPGVWEEATFGKKSYPQDHGEKLYRRSLYIFWRRIVGPTIIFDSASRQVCTVKQGRTNTPLHALTTLNDITYIEAARCLAESVALSLPEDAPLEQLATAAFRRVLVRPPSDEERRVVTESLSRYHAVFLADPAAAARLLAVGESPRRSSAPEPQLAALTALANLLLNLDESLSKE